MERVKETGTPTWLVRSRVRLGNARDQCSKQSPMCYEEDLSATTVGVSIGMDIESVVSCVVLLL